MIGGGQLAYTLLGVDYNPETRKAMKQMGERQVSGAYAALYKKLGLNEQDSKLVSELLAERNFTALDKGRKLLDGKTDDASMAAVRRVWRQSAVSLAASGPLPQTSPMTAE